MEEVKRRVMSLEQMTNGLHTKVGHLETRQEALLEKYSASFESLALQMSTAIQFQRDMLQHTARSLPIADVMKLFSFFAFIIVGILGAVLGVKWMALDLFK